MRKFPVTHLLFDIARDGKPKTIGAILQGWDFVPRVGDRFSIYSLLNMVNENQGECFTQHEMKEIDEALQVENRTSWFKVDHCDVGFDDDFSDKADYNLCVTAFLIPAD